jgi:hypothetical protein
LVIRPTLTRPVSDYPKPIETRKPEPKSSDTPSPLPGKNRHPPSDNGAENSGVPKNTRRREVSERARALVRAQLANGPKRVELVEAAAEAAAISERSLLAATRRARRANAAGAVVAAGVITSRG